MKETSSVSAQNSEVSIGVHIHIFKNKNAHYEVLYNFSTIEAYQIYEDYVNQYGDEESIGEIVTSLELASEIDTYEAAFYNTSIHLRYELINASQSTSTWIYSKFTPLIKSNKLSIEMACWSSPSFK